MTNIAVTYYVEYEFRTLSNIYEGVFSNILALVLPLEYFTDILLNMITLSFLLRRMKKIKRDIMKGNSQNLTALSFIRDHSFSTCVKCSEKRTFLIR